MSPKTLSEKRPGSPQPAAFRAVATKRDRGPGAARLRSRRRVIQRWTLAWVGAPVLAIVNGAIRELGYKDQLGEGTADTISMAPLIALLAVYFWVLHRRWPLATTREALAVGSLWAALSVLFEFGFGHYVEGDSWTYLFQTYDVTAGNLWLLIPLWIAVGPAIVRAIAAVRSN